MCCKHMYKHLVLLLCIIAAVCFKLCQLDSWDAQSVNKYFHKIKHDRKILDYLQTIYNVPIWRSALLQALVTMYAACVYNWYTSRTSLSSIEAFWLGAALLGMFNCIIIYKIKTYFMWHILCDTGCTNTEYLRGDSGRP